MLFLQLSSVGGDIILPDIPIRKPGILFDFLNSIPPPHSQQKQYHFSLTVFS